MPLQRMRQTLGVKVRAVVSPSMVGFNAGPRHAEGLALAAGWMTPSRRKPTSPPLKNSCHLRFPLWSLAGSSTSGRPAVARLAISADLPRWEHASSAITDAASLRLETPSIAIGIPAALSASPSPAVALPLKPVPQNDGAEP